MTGRRKFTFLMAGTAVIIVALFSAQPNAGAAPDNQHLTGSWLLTVNLTNPPPGVTFLSYKTLMTFTADGSVLETSWLPGTASAGHGHGAWERTANGEFAVTAIALWTTAGEPVSVLKARSLIKLSKAGNEFAGTFRADVLDNNGNPIAQGGGVLQGKRIEVE